MNLSLEPGVEPFGSDRLERLIAFTESFRSVFPRSSQFVRFRAYIRGLLEPSIRKNIESIAKVAGELMPAERNVAQALQHFVSQSPWDSLKLMAATRKVVGTHWLQEPGVWVVHEGAIRKKGRSSVGVQRQFDRTTGRKISCQLTVMISRLEHATANPVSGRLYLPAGWLRDCGRIAERAVPEDYRVALSKSALAIALIDELLAEGWPLSQVRLGESFAANEEIAEALQARQVTVLPFESIPVKDDGFEMLKTSLGLDHYEGRSWVGWHHHFSLVLAANAFQIQEQSRSS